MEVLEFCSPKTIVFVVGVIAFIFTCMGYTALENRDFRRRKKQQLDALLWIYDIKRVQKEK